MKIAEKLLINFYSEIIQYLDSIKKLTKNDPDAKKYYNELGKNLYNAEISGLISDDEITQKEFLKLFKRLDQISKDIRDMDLGVSFDDASDFYDNFKSEVKLKENKNLKAVEVKINPFQIYCDINDTLTDGSELPQWTEDGIELWNYISKYDPILLSNDANVNNKIKWIKASIRNLKQYIFYNKDKKQDFASPDTILIDNRSKTIDRWNQAGGIGILFTDAQDVIRQLQQLGL